MIDYLFPQEGVNKNEGFVVVPCLGRYGRSEILCVRFLPNSAGAPPWSMRQNVAPVSYRVESKYP
jgi:hypothetical protein